MVKTDWIDVADTRVFYRHADGPEPTLLFLPGAIADHTGLTWKKVLDRIAGRYRLLAPDLPGFGRSRGLPGVPYSTHYVSGFARAFMHTMGLERPIVLASSMSGTAALALAIRHQEEISGLVISGAFGWQPRLPFHLLIYALGAMPGASKVVSKLMNTEAVVVAGVRLLTKGFALPDEELKADAMLGATAPGAPTAFVEWLRREVGPRRVRYDLRAHLGEIEVPVLVLHGEHDWLLKPSHNEPAVAALPDAEYRTFDGSHLYLRECTEEAVEAIISFLERRFGSSRGTEAYQE